MNAPDKCPKCGAPRNGRPAPHARDFWCDSRVWTDGDFYQSSECVRRERDTLSERVKRLEEARTKAAADSLANMLIHEEAMAKMAALIKRLEEAGEWVAYAANEDDHRAAIQAWNQAKETKP